MPIVNDDSADRYASLRHFKCVKCGRKRIKSVGSAASHACDDNGHSGHHATVHDSGNFYGVNNGVQSEQNVEDTRNIYRRHRKIQVNMIPQAESKKIQVNLLATSDDGGKTKASVSSCWFWREFKFYMCS